jgi:hypothetical protein
MSRAADRRRHQEAEYADQVRASHARPNRPPSPIADADRCPAALGRRCDFTMKGRDGIYRCWTCARRKPTEA